MVSLKRRLAVAGVLFVGVLGLNCRDGMGPSLAGHLAFLPSFASRSAGIVDFDRVRLTLVRQPNMVVLDTMIAISPTADSIDLLLTVQLSSPREDLQLYLCLLTAAGDTVFRNTPYPQIVTLTTSGSVAIVTAPIAYVGVGSDAVAVVITTADTSLLFGDTVRLGAFAFGGLEQIIPGTPIAWRSLDSARVRVPDEAVGTVVGATQRGPARIVAELLTGPADTIILTAQPLPTTVIKASGDVQTAVPLTTLPQPLRVRVLANDGLGVRSISVAFRALAAGAAVSVDTVMSDTLGYAEVIGALGPAIGVQSFEARAAHVATPVTFSATAINATVASVTLDRTVDTIARGATLLYTATARDVLGLPVPVTIGSSSIVQTVATIDQVGLALAIGADSTLIIAAAAGHADTALLYVRALSRVVASPADTVITAVADSFDISATAYDNFGQVVTSGFTRTFSSGTPAVVTVDSKTGRTSSVGPGAGAIVIRDSVDAQLWVQTTATVRVDQLVKRVQNAKASLAIGVGGSAQIGARAYDRNGYPIPGRKFGYVSRDTRFLTVDSSGLVTGVALDVTTYIVDWGLLGLDAGAGGLGTAAAVTMGHRLPGGRSRRRCARTGHTEPSGSRCDHCLPLRVARERHHDRATGRELRRTGAPSRRHQSPVPGHRGVGLRIEGRAGADGGGGFGASVRARHNDRGRAGDDRHDHPRRRHRSDAGRADVLTSDGEH